MRSFLALLNLALFYTLSSYGQIFQGVSSAKVSLVNGVPELLINGTPTPPLLFWYNVEAGYSKKMPFIAAQVGSAAQNGVHIYQTNVGFQWFGSHPNAQLDWTGASDCFQVLHRP